MKLLAFLALSLRMYASDSAVYTIDGASVRESGYVLPSVDWNNVDEPWLLAEYCDKLPKKQFEVINFFSSKPAALRSKNGKQIDHVAFGYWKSNFLEERQKPPLLGQVIQFDQSYGLRWLKQDMSIGIKNMGPLNIYRLESKNRTTTLLYAKVANLASRFNPDVGLIVYLQADVTSEIEALQACRDFVGSPQFKWRCSVGQEVRRIDSQWYPFWNPFIKYPSDSSDIDKQLSRVFYCSDKNGCT